VKSFKGGHSKQAGNKSVRHSFNQIIRSLKFMFKIASLSENYREKEYEKS